MAPKYFETVFEIRVLSDNGPLDGSLDLSAIAYAITDGDCVGQFSETDRRELTGAEAAQRLLDFGSEPEFFSLDDEGNNAEDN